MARSDLVTVNFYTSLDTALTIAVKPHDTVASAKRQFVSDHELCYPEFGQINLEALLIYWEGKDYHLPETMPISIVLKMMKEYRILTALVASQLQPRTEINTSLKKKKKKKKRKRNASFEDTTTVRPTQSRKIGEEKFQGHGENRPSNDSYCDAKNGEYRKGETNHASIAVCEAEYIKEAPLCLEKEKDIFRKKSRHDSESPEIPGHGENQPSNDSYCDANKGESRKEAPLCLEKEKEISGNNSRHDSESTEIIKHKPQVEEDRNQVSLSHKEKAEKPASLLLSPMVRNACNVMREVAAQWLFKIWRRG